MTHVVEIPSSFISRIMLPLHGAEIKILLVLIALGAIGEPVEASMDVLGTQTGLSRRAVYDGVAALQERGYVTRTRDAGGSRTYAYSVRDFNEEPDETPSDTAADPALPPISAEVVSLDSACPTEVQSAASPEHELDSLLRVVVPSLPREQLRELVASETDELRLVACLREMVRKGYSYADCGVFLSAVAHHCRTRDTLTYPA
jgi:predicted transcriptional regulator